MGEFIWTKNNGQWCIRCVEGEAQTGDRVLVRKRTGSSSAVILGEEIAPGIFANATPKRGGRKARGGYAPEPIYDPEQAAEMRFCHGVDSYGDSLRGYDSDREPRDYED